MDTLVGFLLIIVGIGLGVYSYVTPDFEYGIRFYLQMGTCVFGSILIFWDRIVSLVNFKGGDPDMPIDDTDHSSDDDCGYCVKDFHCLSYLKKRAQEIESQEALDLVIKLNTLLFSGNNHAKDK